MAALQITRNFTAGLSLLFVFLAEAYGQTLVTGVPLDDRSKSTQTRPFAIYANTGALPSTGCVAGSYAEVTASGLYRNTGTGACSWAAAGVGGVTSVGVVGTTNQITVSGTSPITGAGTFTLSIPAPLVIGSVFEAGGPCESSGSASTPASNNINLFCDSGNLNHASAKFSTSAVVDLQPIRRLAAYTFDGGGSAISGTQDACVDVPAAATITGVTLLADQAGSGTVDIKTVAYSSYTGPASTSSITAAAVPAISSAIKYQDSTLTGWTTAIAANTVLCFHLTSPATSTWIMVDVKGSN